MGWLTRLFRGKSLDQELDRELRAHLDLLTDDLMRSGLSPEEARRQAALAFGGVDSIKEASRDARGTRFVLDWWQDTRYALRALRRSPGFTAAAVLTLAIGIGANTAVWSVLDALLLRGLPVERSDELVALRHGVPGANDPSYILSYQQMGRLQQRLPTAIRLAGMSSLARMYLASGERSEPLNVQLVSGNWFHVVGVGAGHGRVMDAGADPDARGQPVGILSDAYWTAHFGRDPTVVGRTMRLNGVSLLIVGVAEPGFGGLTVGAPVDLWVPLWLQQDTHFPGNAFSQDADPEKPWLPQNGVQWLTLVARAPTATRPQAEAALATQFRAEQLELYQNADSNERSHALKETLQLESIGRGFSPLRQSFGDPLLVLMVSVGLVLLIACANLASLLLARGAAREHEVAVRVSLGARAGRLLRQVLTESLTLSVLGGLLSPLLAWWGGLALLRAASSGPRPIALPLALDARVLGFALLLAVVTGLLFGLAPALRASRSAPFGSFKAGGRVAHRLPLGRALVVSQVALSLVLIAAAGLFVRTLRNYLRVDAGYASEQVLEARIEPRPAGYSFEELPGLYQRLHDAVSALPGVKSVGLALYGLGTTGVRIGGILTPALPRPPGWNARAQENYVSPGYFATVGMVLLRGREFTEADRAGAPPVAVVSESFAQHFFGTQDVLGKRTGYGAPGVEIVGVVRDARMNGIKVAPARWFIKPLAQGPHEYALSVEARIAGSAERLSQAMRAAIQQAEPRLPIREVVTVADLLERGLSRERLLARLAGVFSAMALLLAAIGLYGVVAFSVSRRTNEMGVRIALGALPWRVWRLVLRDSLGMVILGLLAGLALWVPAQSVLRNLVFGLSPRDPVTLGFSVAVLALVGIVAASLPAWRAARVDPASALRDQ